MRMQIVPTVLRRSSVGCPAGRGHMHIYQIRFIKKRHEMLLAYGVAEVQRNQRTHGSLDPSVDCKRIFEAACANTCSEAPGP